MIMTTEQLEKIAITALNSAYHIHQKLGDKGIVLLRQLAEISISELSNQTGVESNRLEQLVQKAKNLLS